MRRVTGCLGEMTSLELAGVADAIAGTAIHAMFSEDRGEHVPLRGLMYGERGSGHRNKEPRRR